MKLSDLWDGVLVISSIILLGGGLYYTLKGDNAFGVGCLGCGMALGNSCIIRDLKENKNEGRKRT